MSPALCKVWMPKLHHCDLVLCFKAKPSQMPQFPLPLCTTASFPPALCRGFPSSFAPEELYFPVLPHCDANGLARRAGGCASQGRTASTAPGKAQQSRLDLVCQHSDTGMLLPTAAQPELKENCSSKKKKNTTKPRHCNVPECLGKKGVKGVSPVLVFFKYQFKLHYIPQEVVEIMGFPGLWAKSP